MAIPITAPISIRYVFITVRLVSMRSGTHLGRSNAKPGPVFAASTATLIINVLGMLLNCLGELHLITLALYIPLLDALSSCRSFPSHRVPSACRTGAADQSFSGGLESL